MRAAAAQTGLEARITTEGITLVKLFLEIALTLVCLLFWSMTLLMAALMKMGTSVVRLSAKYQFTMPYESGRTTLGLAAGRVAQAL